MSDDRTPEKVVAEALFASGSISAPLAHAEAKVAVAALREAGFAILDSADSEQRAEMIEAGRRALMARRLDWRGTTGPGFSLAEPDYPQGDLARGLSATVAAAAFDALARRQELNDG